MVMNTSCMNILFPPLLVRPFARTPNRNVLRLSTVITPSAVRSGTKHRSSLNTLTTSPATSTER